MQRFYQGQLDFFCAIYAVINALTALYGISLTQGRALFATILSDISQHSELWHATLENGTDFHWLVEHMALACQKGTSCPVRVHRPFAAVRDIPESAADLDFAQKFTDGGCSAAYSSFNRSHILWEKMEEWLLCTPVKPRAGTLRHVALLRFHRYIPFVETPIVSHWSVADYHHNGIIYLRDASKEENAVYSFDKEATAFSREGISDVCNVYIEPESVFFMERR